MGMRVMESKEGIFSDEIFSRGTPRSYPVMM